MMVYKEVGNILSYFKFKIMDYLNSKDIKANKKALTN